jgi:cardiolipin synthase
MSIALLPSINVSVGNKFIYFQRTLSRYFDASLVTAQLQPTLISKVNTVVQLMLVASVMAAPVWSFPSAGTLQALR